VSIVTTAYVGPQTLCIGPNKSQSCFLPAGSEDFDTVETIVTVNVAAVPTLSSWGLCALVAGLGALALRRLRLPSRG
jgi:hypothetical protein